MAPGDAQGLVLQCDGYGREARDGWPAHRREAGPALNFTLADVDYLTSDEGSAALADAATLPLAEGDRIADVTRLREHHGARAAVLLETTLLRRKAVAKLPGASDWLFTDEALQQATAAPVAQHRAKRLAGRVVHDVTCSIGAELSALRHCADAVLGSDLDPVRLAMARHNLSLDADGAPVQLCRADALAPVSAGAVIVADPARRSGGRRTFDPRAYQPALDELLQTYRGSDFVVKIAPGADFDALAQWGFDGEIEVTSWGGSVREACLWSGGLAQARRRASVLDTGEHLVDSDPDDCDVSPVDRFLVDPDGAVVRAGLVRQYAARHGLSQLDPQIAYLTGPALPTGTRGFEVIDSIKFSEKTLRQALSQLDCGPLEILVRGVRVEPDALRRRLKPRGSTPLTVVITRIGPGASAQQVAYICRAQIG